MPTGINQRNGGSSKIQKSRIPLEIHVYLRGLFIVGVAVVRPTRSFRFFLSRIRVRSNSVGLEVPGSCSPLRSVYQLTRTSPPLPGSFVPFFPPKLPSIFARLWISGLMFQMNFRTFYDWEFCSNFSEIDQTNCRNCTHCTRVCYSRTYARTLISLIVFSINFSVSLISPPLRDEVVLLIGSVEMRWTCEPRQV